MSRHTSSWLPAIAVGAPVVLSLGVLLWPRSASARERTMQPLLTDWIPTLLAKTSAHEGTFWSVQRNLDGNGVSYGILQWTQKAGGLADVLAAMVRADPATFERLFGPSWQALLEHTRRRSLAPLDGALLWNEPWLSRFIAAGRHGPFQVAQSELAAHSEYMAGAVQLAHLLGPSTERAMVLYYNRTVHQGVQGALRPARALVAWWAEAEGRKPAADNDVLAQYAWMCAAKFRRTSPPDQLCYNDGCNITWKAVKQELSALETGGDYRVRKVPVSGVWHAVTGPWDLYDLIVGRSSEILRDPGLRDVGVRLPVVVG